MNSTIPKAAMTIEDKGRDQPKEEAEVVSREIETTVREDGSRTTVTVITTRLPDGSTTVQRERVHLPPPSSSSTTPPVVPAKSSTAISNAPPQVETTNAPPEIETPSLLFVASVVAAMLMVVLGFVATAKTVQANKSDNDNYDADGKTAQRTGAVAIVAALVAVPLAFCEASSHGHGGGNQCLMISAWILFGLGMANAVAILVASFQEDTGIQASLVSAQVILLLIAYICMISHAEMCRRGRRHRHGVMVNAAP